ncbi:MAG TPA: septum formation initiator family protein [Candidatus Bipolaricaulota bacterium]|nr:septum formation initiator family protein [Candidatus Bipolaricaulota bacterium]
MLEKKTFFGKFNSKILIISGLVLIALFSVAASREFIHKHQLDKEISDLEKEIDRLKIEQDEFITLIDNYNSQEFIEQAARENFNYKKRGEKVVLIKTNEDNVPPDLSVNGPNGINSSASETLSGKSNVKLWWDYFFGDKVS